jgi:hypothetical protein
MNSIALKDLKPKIFFSKPLFLDEGFVLLAPETPVDEGLISETGTVGIPRDEDRGRAPCRGRAGGSATIAGEGAVVPTALPDGAGDKERVAKILAFYSDFTTIWNPSIRASSPRPSWITRSLVERMKGLCQVIAENKRFLLRAQSLAPQHSNYLVSHAVRSSVYSIVLGTAIKLPPFKLIELGAAAALHEIGMVRLPPQLYMAGRALSPQEKKSITAHPILGYNLLKDRQVPLAVCLAALEHHERMNGSGYPRALTGDKIPSYSKIIMVACSFDAVTANRPYKEAKDGYSGMVDILKNEGKQYDDLVIRALVYSLSIYPIGT